MTKPWLPTTTQPLPAWTTDPRVYPPSRVLAFQSDCAEAIEAQPINKAAMGSRVILYIIRPLGTEARNMRATP